MRANRKQQSDWRRVYHGQCRKCGQRHPYNHMAFCSVLRMRRLNRPLTQSQLARQSEIIYRNTWGNH
jgi:hypothetical protein